MSADSLLKKSNTEIASFVLTLRRTTPADSGYAAQACAAANLIEEQARALSEGVATERARCLACVPHSWLDPLMDKAGPLGQAKAVAWGYTPQAVEALLLAVRAAVEAK